MTDQWSCFRYAWNTPFLTPCKNSHQQPLVSASIHS